MLELVVPPYSLQARLTRTYCTYESLQARRSFKKRNQRKMVIG
jgi:hypothetical protein